MKRFLRKYTTAWVLNRCLSLHFVDLLQKKLKRHLETVDLLKWLMYNKSKNFLFI